MPNDTKSALRRAGRAVEQAVALRESVAALKTALVDAKSPDPVMQRFAAVEQVVGRAAQELAQEGGRAVKAQLAAALKQAGIKQ